MRKYTVLTTVVLLTEFLFFFSCRKIDLPKDTPICIKNKIRMLKIRTKRNPTATVWSYKYNGKTVYFIPADCCDKMGELFDENCNLICHPDGGFSGDGDGKCSDFSINRKDEKLIWKDKN